MIPSVPRRSVLYGAIGAVALQLVIDGFFVFVTLASSRTEQLLRLTHFTPVALLGGMFAGYVWWRVGAASSRPRTALWVGMAATLGSYIFLLGYSIVDSRYFLPIREGTAFRLLTYTLYGIGGVVGASVVALGYLGIRRLRMRNRSE